MRSYRPALVLAAIAFGTAGSYSRSAHAQAPCVVCEAPAANYRCVIPESDLATIGKAGERAIHFVCITELAKQGGHSSCRVRRDLVATCDAPDRLVSLQQLQSPAAAPEPKAAASPAQPVAGPVAATTNTETTAPPQTLVELAERTASQSGDQLKKAGSAVNEAAKSTGNAIGQTLACIAALFQNCGSDGKAGSAKAP